MAILLRRRNSFCMLSNMARDTQNNTLYSSNCKYNSCYFLTVCGQCKEAEAGAFVYGSLMHNYNLISMLFIFFIHYKCITKGD